MKYVKYLPKWNYSLDVEITYQHKIDYVKNGLNFSGISSEKYFTQKRFFFFKYFNNYIILLQSYNLLLNRLYKKVKI